MTQNIDTQAPAPAAATTPAPAPAATAPRPATVDDVIQRVDGATSAIVGRLPADKRHVWFPRRNAQEVALLMQAVEANPNLAPNDKQRRMTELLADLEPTVFSGGKPCPVGTQYTILWLFDNSDHIAVYALPLAAGQDPGKRELLAEPRPARFKLSTRGPQFTVSLMPLETWIGEVGEELDAVDQTTVAPEGLDEPEDEPGEDDNLDNG
jgi:hypothetical protein